MTAREALFAFARERELADAPSSFEDCYSSFWIWLKLGSRRVPIFPLRPFRSETILHDLHHLVAGYETTWRGEVEVAAWELGAGGCGWKLYLWLDRLLFLVAGCLFLPRATWRAFRRGRHGHNLYAQDVDAVLATDIERLRARVEGGH